MTAQVTLYFDLHSPYSYFAFHTLKNNPSFAVYPKTYIPITIAGLAKAIGVTPPWGIPNKEKWIRRDLEYTAKQNSIPLAPLWPEKYPETMTFKVQRLLCACATEYPEKYEAVIAALCDEMWGMGKSVHDEVGMSPVLATVLEETEINSLIRMASSQKAKDMLRKNTKQAAQVGACGLPWIRAVNEQCEEMSVWGFDRLDRILEFLGRKSLPSML